MTLYQQNPHNAQELQKPAHDKGMKSKTYALSNNVQFNSKYIKTKYNCKLKAKFFNLFQVLYLIGKQAYKLELSKKQKIHDVFHILLLKQDIIKKMRVNIKLKFEANDNKEYEVEGF